MLQIFPLRVFLAIYVSFSLQSILALYFPNTFENWTVNTDALIGKHLTHFILNEKADGGGVQLRFPLPIDNFVITVIYLFARIFKK